MADGMTIDVDASALIVALDRLGAAADSHVKAAAKITAGNISREAHQRIARAAGGPTRSRHTAEGITVEETHDGRGYVVFVNSPDMAHLPGWLEFGTKYMTARPFLFNSARLEEGAHMRRVEDAVSAALHETGLGD